MGKNSTAEISLSGEDVFVRGTNRLPFKRTSHMESPRPHTIDINDGAEERDRRSDRQSRSRSRLFRGGGGRKGITMKRSTIFYIAVVVSFVVFITAAMSLQSSITSVFRSGGERGWGLGKGGVVLGSALRFLPLGAGRKFVMQGNLDALRAPRRFAVRPPRLAFVIGSLKNDPTTLKLLTVAKNLKGLGYILTIYAVEDGEAHSLWNLIGYQVSIIGLDVADHIDWSMFEGIVLCSIEVESSISSLMKEPFCSIPMIWIIQEDTLGKRLPVYAEMGWKNLIMKWKSAFSRADVVLFPDYSLPMLYSSLDTGNFFVISGSPVDVWSAESYLDSHSKSQMRRQNGFNQDDLIILVVGSSLFYNELPWDFAVAMHALRPLLMKFTRDNLGDSFKLVFLCGNSTDGYHNALQEIASRMGFPDGSIKHYGIDSDVNSILLMADVVLYGSFQQEQGFPPLLIRAMSFQIPIIAPDLTIIKKYVVDGVHGLIYQARSPDSLARAFSIFIPNMKLSKFSQAVASSGKLLARNLMASDCIIGFAKLLENILQFPSDTMLPGSISPQEQYRWEWNLFGKESKDTEIEKTGSSKTKFSVIDTLEEELAGNNYKMDTVENETEVMMHDGPIQIDWDDAREIEISEEFESREMQELEARTEKTSASWEEIYRNARKAEKLNFEVNERDEGELERTGQPICIYEIYSGDGAWPFLHHGALYRGLSLSTSARRRTSDDVDAVGRLPLLNNTYYRDHLCEIGGMFSIANHVDDVHKIPWIGFQSWHATGRKVSLSTEAEKALEHTIQAESKGDVIYYWARSDKDVRFKASNDHLNFWSLCDILNGGVCREAFENSFRQMYGLPAEMAALPPMPDDGDHWSVLHSWAMPTPSFLEFIMFTRMFVDSLDSFSHDLNNSRTCSLGSSALEEKHCYCRMLELLVNVWAYHSARRMVYINPISGSLEEQHSIEKRIGLMWVKYFNFTLLKSMDEDLAEEADDHDHPDNSRLWPLTGEVHWKGAYEREREERYRIKMDKKRKNKEKLLERQKHGYKQKSLALPANV